MVILSQIGVTTMSVFNKDVLVIEKSTTLFLKQLPAPKIIKIFSNNQEFKTNEEVGEKLTILSFLGIPPTYSELKLYPS